jgi:hypothetical protein
MSLIAYHMQDVDTLESRLDGFRKVIPDRGAVSISKTSDLPINYEYLLLPTARGLEYVVNNTHAFDFLKSIAQHYSIIVNNEVRENVISTLEKHYDGIGKLIGKTIYEAGLVG